MAVVAEKREIGGDRQHADQLTTDVVLVVSDCPGGGSESATKLEQHKKQNKQTGHDCKANIA